MNEPKKWRENKRWAIVFGIDERKLMIL